MLVGLDQLTKWLAATHLAGNDPIVLIDGIFELNYIENTGAAFGIFSDSRIMLIVITSVALLGLLYVMISGELGRSKLVLISGTMILSGGVGNMIDRIFRQKVVDFFYFKAIDFAIFNVADSFIVVGSSLLLLYFLFIHKEQTLKKPEGEGDAANGAADTETFTRDNGGEA